MMKTSRPRLQFEPQSAAPFFFAARVLPSDMMIGADNLKALNDGKVMTRWRRRRRRVFLPVAGPCFDHHQVLDRRPTTHRARPNSLLNRRPRAIPRTRNDYSHDRSVSVRPATTRSLIRWIIERSHAGQTKGA